MNDFAALPPRLKIMSVYRDIQECFTYFGLAGLDLAAKTE
jgi:hypothetical protein